MAAARSLIRIAVNVAIDGVLAAASVPLAGWMADPAGAALHPLWLLPAGAAALLLAGVPFRLSLQYWRFAGLDDLLAVAASSAAGASLFALLRHLAGAAVRQSRLPAGACPDPAAAARHPAGDLPPHAGGPRPTAARRTARRHPSC